MRPAVTAALALLAAACAGSARGAELVNPSFETHSREGFAGWTGVRVQPVSRDWRRLAAGFTTRGCSKGEILVRLPAGGGRLWVDSVRLSGVSDGDFERGSAEKPPAPPWFVQGNAALADDFALAPGFAARLASDEAAPAVLRQSVDLPASGLAQLELSWRAESPRSAATVEVTGRRGQAEAEETLFSASLGRPGEEKAGGVWCARLDGSRESPASVATVFASGAGQTLAVFFEVLAESSPCGLSAEVVGPAAGGGAAPDVWRIRARADTGRWSRSCLVFSARRAGNYTLSFSADEAPVRLDEVSVGAPRPVPAPRNIKVAEAAANFALERPMAFLASGPAAAAVARRIAPLLGVEEAALDMREASSLKSEPRGGPRVVVVCGEDGAAKSMSDDLGIEMPSAAEGYSMRVSRDEMVVSGASAAGLRQAARALSYLVTAPPARREAVGAVVSDSPARPTRGMAFEWPSPGASGQPISPVAAAGLGLNLVVIDAPFVFDDEPPPAAWESLRGEVEGLRGLGIGAVVVARCIGSSRQMLQRCPEAASARWAYGERHELKGDDAVFLAQPNVLRSGATFPEVLGPSGERCAEGTDYVLSPGATRYPFPPSAPGWRLKRVLGGRLADGAAVICRYDFALPATWDEAPMCPSEPAARERAKSILTRLLSRVPADGVFVGGVAPRACRCSRCARSGLTQARLHADQLAGIVRAVAAAPAFAKPASAGEGRSPEARVFVMSDLFDPPSGADPGLLPTAEFLPEEVRRRLVVVVREGPGAAGGVGSAVPKGFAVLRMRSFAVPVPAAPEGGAGCIFEIPARDDRPIEPAAEALWGTR